jgi:hypothetical protein
MNERTRELLDEVYKSYSIKNFCNTISTKEDFIKRIKTNIEFSERWELKIEERELSLRERLKLVGMKDDIVIESVIHSRGEDFHKTKMDRMNIPTKLITVTYKNEKIESYE